MDHRGSTRSLAAKIRSLRFDVPWCVPQWSWAEGRVATAVTLTGRVVSGGEGDRLRAEIADRAHVKYVVATNFARFAIQLALESLDIGAGDEVVVPSYVCPSAVDPIHAVGATPRYADVEADLHVSVRTIEAALGPRVKAVLVPHLFGNVAPVAEIEELLRGSEVALIDDAAQSFGASVAGRPVGTFGRCGIVSCGMGKALAGPAGGLLLTDNEALYDRAQQLLRDPERTGTVLRRHMGCWIWRRFRRHSLLLRVLLDRVRAPASPSPLAAGSIANLDAAIMRTQLRHLDRSTDVRRRNARLLLDHLGPLRRYVITDVSATATVVKLIVVLPEAAPLAEELVPALADAGLECQPGYRPCHLDEGESPPSLPTTEALWRRVLCIPTTDRLRDPASLRRFVERCDWAHDAPEPGDAVGDGPGGSWPGGRTHQSSATPEPSSRSGTACEEL